MNLHNNGPNIVYLNIYVFQSFLLQVHIDL